MKISKYGFTCLILMIAVTACQQSPSFANSPPADEKPRFNVAGQVVLSNGKPAGEALIRFRDGMGDWEQAVANERGEFEVPLNCRPHAIVYFYAADRSEIFWMELRNNNIADRIATPLNVVLVPATAIPVLVQKNGVPIKGASVAGRIKEFGWNFAPEKTNANGTTKVLIPAAHQLDQIWSIESKNGLGGRAVFANNPPDVVNIELMPNRRKEVLVLDDQEKPVAGIRVMASLRCRDRSMLTGQLPEFYSVTNAEGRAIFDWTPADDKWGFHAGIYENVHYSWDSSKKGDRNQTFDTGPYRDLRLLYVTAIPDAIKVSGRIKRATGKASRVRVSAQGMRPLGQSDLVDSVSDESGNFSMNLIPGIIYIVGITDDKLACDLVEVKVDADSEQIDPIELVAYRAIPLTVKVTQGKDKRPLSNVSVQHFQSKEIQFSPTHSGQPSLSQGKILDDQGVVVFGSPTGKIRINLGSQKWRTAKDIEVIAGEPMTIEFHAPAIGIRKVTGTITAPQTPVSKKYSNQILELESKLEGKDETERSAIVLKKEFVAERIRKHNENLVGDCAVTIFDPLARTILASTKADRNGNWSAELDGNRICVYAVSSDGKLACFETYSEVGEEIEPLELKPAVSVSGQLTSPDGTPLANRKISLATMVQHDIIALQVHFASTETDEDGRFNFPSVPTGLEHRIYTRNNTGNDQSLTPATKHEPGEDVADLKVTYQERVPRPLKLPKK